MFVEGVGIPGAQEMQRLVAEGKGELYMSPEQVRAVMPQLRGLPLCIEHDEKLRVGEIVDVWGDPVQGVMVRASLNNQNPELTAEVARLIRAGELAETSLAHLFTIKALELSVVRKGRRDGCNLGLVQASEAAAAPTAARPAIPYLPLHLSTSTLERTGVGRAEGKAPPGTHRVLASMESAGQQQEQQEQPQQPPQAEAQAQAQAQAPPQQETPQEDAAAAAAAPPVAPAGGAEEHKESEDDAPAAPSSPPQQQQQQQQGQAERVPMTDDEEAPAKEAKTTKSKAKAKAKDKAKAAPAGKDQQQQQSAEDQVRYEIPREQVIALAENLGLGGDASFATVLEAVASQHQRLREENERLLKERIEKEKRERAQKEVEPLHDVLERLYSMTGEEVPREMQEGLLKMAMNDEQREQLPMMKDFIAQTVKASELVMQQARAESREAHSRQRQRPMAQTHADSNQGIVQSWQRLISAFPKIQQAEAGGSGTQQQQQASRTRSQAAPAGEEAPPSAAASAGAGGHGVVQASAAAPQRRTNPWESVVEGLVNGEGLARTQNCLIRKAQKRPAMGFSRFVHDAMRRDARFNMGGSGRVLASEAAAADDREGPSYAAQGVVLTPEQLINSMG